MEIGNDHDPVWKNEWPAESDVPEFKDTMLAFQKAAHELHMKVMSSIAIGLGLDPNFFDDKCNEEWHNLRLLHYPSVKNGQVEGGRHSTSGRAQRLREYHAALPGQRGWVGGEEPAYGRVSLCRPDRGDHCGERRRPVGEMEQRSVEVDVAQGQGASGGG